MGPGCEEVARTFTPDADVIVGRWKDGRIGTVRALRPYSDYGAVVFRPKQILESPSRPADSYRPLLVEIVKFFETGQPPVPNAETLEIYAFMDAAQRSKEDGGKPNTVTIEDYAMSKLLEGKTALILGIANKWSLAYAIAQAFWREGATLALTYLGDRQKIAIEELSARQPVAGHLALRRHQG